MSYILKILDDQIVDLIRATYGEFTVINDLQFKYFLFEEYNCVYSRLYNEIICKFDNESDYVRFKLTVGHLI